MATRPAKTELMAFTIEEVSNLCGLTPSRIRAWQTSLYRPHWDSGLYTFRDLVALRTLGRLRSLHVSKRNLERIGGGLEEKYDQPWSRLKFGVGPKGKLYYADPETGAWIRDDGQTITEVALDHFQHELERDVRRARQRDPSTYGKLAKNRGICGGRRRVAGTRITLDTLRPYLEEGYSDNQLLREFPLLKRADLAVVRKELAA